MSSYLVIVREAATWEGLGDVRECSCVRRELMEQPGRWHSVLCVTAEPVPGAAGGAAFQRG